MASAFLSSARAKASLSTPFRVVPFSRYGVVFQFFSSARSAGSAATAGFAGAAADFCAVPGDCAGFDGGSIAAPMDCGTPRATAGPAANVATIKTEAENHLGCGLFIACINPQ